MKNCKISQQLLSYRQIHYSNNYTKSTNSKQIKIIKKKHQMPWEGNINKPGEIEKKWDLVENKIVIFRFNKFANLKQIKKKKIKCLKRERSTNQEK